MNLDGDPHELQRRLDRLPEGHPGRPQILNELAWSVRMSDMERAHRLAEQARSEAEALGDRRALGWAWRALAFFNLLSPSVAETLTRARRALEHFAACDEELGQAMTWDLMATIHEMLGDYSVAMQYALDANEVFRRLGNERGIAWSLSSIGGILAASGDLDAAERHFEEGLEIFERLDYPLGISRLCGRLGRLYLDRGLLDQARMYFERDHAIWQLVDFPVFHAGSLANLGELHEALGELERARELYQQAHANAPEPLRESLGLMTAFALARIQYKQGDVQTAARALATVADQAAASGIAPLESKARELLAEILEEAGQPAAALRELRRHLSLREHILSGEHRTKLKHLELRKEIEASRKDAEIHRLRYVELAEAQTRLIEAEKLAVLGKLAAGVAHETNSPLGVIRNSVVTLERAAARVAEAVGPESEVHGVLDAMRVSVELIQPALDRLVGIATSLRRFAHLDGAEEQAVDLVEGLEGALTLLLSSADAGLQVERSLSPLPPVLGHPGQLNQVFLTLLGHAIETAREVSGTVRVSSRAEALQAVIRIESDPAAFSPDELGDLFDVRLGRKGAQVRFRIGMSAAASTVRKHGGEISAEHSSRGSAVITVKLPVLSDGRT